MLMGRSIASFVSVKEWVFEQWQVAWRIDMAGRGFQIGSIEGWGSPDGWVKAQIFC